MGPACRDQPRLGVLEGKRGRGGGDPSRGQTSELRYHLLPVRVSPEGELRGEAWAGPDLCCDGVSGRPLHPGVQTHPGRCLGELGAVCQLRTIRLTSWEGPEGIWFMGRAAHGMGAWEGQRLMEDPACGAWLCRPFAGAQSTTVEPGAGQPGRQWAKTGQVTLRHRRSLSLSGPGLAPWSSARGAPMPRHRRPVWHRP